MKNLDLNEIINCLKTVYDPEFPMVDLYTLGLIYDVKLNGNNVFILMTYTTIACPLGDMLHQLVKNAINDKYPQCEVSIEITFDPTWTPKMIKDPDLQKLFNN